MQRIRDNHNVCFGIDKNRSLKIEESWELMNKQFVINKPVSIIFSNQN